MLLPTAHALTTPVACLLFTIITIPTESGPVMDIAAAPAGAPVTVASTGIPGSLLPQRNFAEILRSLRLQASGAVSIVDCNGAYDQETIQGAIDAADDGDVIVVLPNTCSPTGAYHENINFLGKAITVQSILPSNPQIVDATVIDGSQLDRVIIFNHSEGPDTVLAGLTVTNGLGGILCEGASPTIRYCNITANSGAPVGGGIFVDSGGSPAILNCRITYNACLVAGGGYSAHHNSRCIMANTLVAGNTSGYSGGGIALFQFDGALIEYCTIADNLVTTDESYGGGGVSTVTDFGELAISNSILSGNSAPQGPAIFVGGASVTIRHSAVPGGVSSIAGPDPVTWGEGNIFADPHFADAAAGDYGLDPASLCIDNGDPSATVEPGENDVAGQPRRQHCRVDMGAHESATPRDCDDNGAADHCEILNGTAADDNGNLRPDVCETLLYVDCSVCPTPGSGSLSDPFCAVQQGIDAALAGDQVVLAASDECTGGAYLENIEFFGKSITVRSTAPTDPAVVSAAVIDGSASDASVVTFQYSEGPGAVLEGLTITAGSGTPFDQYELNAPYHAGGGIFCKHTSPTVRRCRITGNQATRGGGVYVVGGAPSITLCDIIGNVIQPEESGSPFSVLYGAGGGGLRAHASALVLGDCRIEGNTAEVVTGEWEIGAVGAGLSISIPEGQVMPVQINRCTVHSNQIAADADLLESFGGGISIWADSGAEVAIRNCMITNNRAPEGAGLDFSGVGMVSLQGTTVAGNGFDEGLGDGLRAMQATVHVANSILYDNAPFDVAESTLQPEYVFSYSDIGVTEVVIDGPGNISADPLFVDPGQDFHLDAASPCIEAGDPVFVAGPDETDIDGDPRVLGVRIDMGADEFHGACPADLNSDGLVDTADLAALLGSWGPSPDCPSDLNKDGVVDTADLGLLLANWGPCQ